MPDQYVSRTDVILAAERLAEGVDEHFASYPVLFVNGAQKTPAEASADLRRLAALLVSVDEARRVYETTLQRARAEAPPLLAEMGAIKTLVRGSFGNAADTLGDFGLAPRRPPTPLTTEQKLTAVEKAKSTREARHTMGPRQRAAIHGTVVGVTIEPLTAPAPAPTPALTPAPSPSPTPSTPPPP